MAAALGLVGTSMVLTARAAIPQGFSDTVVVDSITLPVGLDFTPDGRMLVTTKPGQLYVVKNGVKTLALDNSTATCAKAPGGDERGMLGIAVDPNFATNNYVYVYYSVNKGTAGCFNRVSRFTLSSTNTISTSTQKVLLDNIKGDGFHNAGDLAFGKDGNLYVSVGDGHCLEGCDPTNNAAKDLKNLNGKVLRITASGGIPTGNPFGGTGTARCNTAAISSGKCQEIYAYGFRNPFRIAVDPNTAVDSTHPIGRIFVNDVGQNAIEEIDQLKAGANYGWPTCEGKCTTAGLTNPIHQYAANIDNTTRAAIVGGVFVPNNRWDPAYNNQYLFSDYLKKRIYRIPNTGGTRTTFEDGATGIAMKFAPANLGGTGTQQALYYTNLGTNTVHRIIANATKPTSAFTTNAPTGPVTNCSKPGTTAGDPPFDVTFNGGASADPRGRPLTYHWNFGDGTPVTDTTTPTTTHTYTTRGNFQPTLTVSNDLGDSSTTAAGQVRTDFAPPTPVITAPAATDTFAVGRTYTPQGTATDSTGAALPASALTWQVWLFHINHVHPIAGPVAGDGATSFLAPAAEQLSAIKGSSRLLICLSATDSHGITRTIEQDFNPHLVQLTLTSNPAGLKLHIDQNDLDPTANGDVTTPATITSWEGYHLTLTARNQTDSTGQGQVFGSWSDGGAQSHDVTTPATDTTYTATFHAGSVATSYEAEAGTVAGGATVASCTACSGGKKVGHVGMGGTLTFSSVNAATAGTYQLVVTYACGDPAGSRNAVVTVNGASQTVNFPNTGGFSTPGSKTITVTLKAGANVIQFANATAWAPDFDKITG
jgi:glucose/arabinose dehydrogenase